MTVSGSGRTREKDTRAPARGPFCVLGSSWQGRRTSSCRGLAPFGALRSVCMPVARPIYAARRGDPHPFRCLRTAVHQPGACISYALSGRFGAPRQHSLCTHMPAPPHALLTDSPYPFFTYAAGVPVPLSFLVLTPEAAGRSIEQGSLVEYLSSSCLSGFFMSAF